MSSKPRAPKRPPKTAARAAAAPRAGVLERALSILDCFSEERLRLHLRELAELTGLDKATLLRFLNTLTRHNYVHRFEDGRYAPGAAHLRLGALYRATTDLGARMTPVVQSVSDQVGESVAFYIRTGDERMCLFRDNVPRTVRHFVEVGSSVPLSEGGASAHVLRAFTDGSGPHADAIRAAGFHLTRAERSPDLTSIAVPVFDSDGAFLGVLSVVGLVNRQTKTAQLAAKEIMIRELAAKGFFVKRPASLSMHAKN